MINVNVKWQQPDCLLIVNLMLGIVLACACGFVICVPAAQSGGDVLLIIGGCVGVWLPAPPCFVYFATYLTSLWHFVFFLNASQRMYPVLGLPRVCFLFWWQGSYGQNIKVARCLCHATAQFRINNILVWEEQGHSEQFKHTTHTHTTHAQAYVHTQ